MRIASAREKRLSRDELTGSPNEGSLVANHVVLELQAGDVLWLQIKEMGHVMSTGRVVKDNVAAYRIAFMGYILWLRD